MVFYVLHVVLISKNEVSLMIFLYYLLECKYLNKNIYENKIINTIFFKKNLSEKF